MTSKNIEALVVSRVRHIYMEYPDLEWEDLIGQAWLIVTEQIGGYDKTKGAALGTYLYHKLQGGLSDYARRVVLRGQNMQGMRYHGEYAEQGTEGSIEDQVEAKMELERILDGEEGVSRDIVELMMQGYNQSECADTLGISRQLVSYHLTRIRRDYE